MRRWSVGLVACAVAVPLLLSGCAEKHQASQSLPTASTTTPAKTLPPLGPADFPVPAAARHRTAAGATSFVHYYIELTNFLLPTLDSHPLRDLSRNCALCNQLADGYDQNKSAGYSYQGGRLTIKSLGAPTVTGNNAQFAFILQQEAFSVADSSGRPVPNKASEAYELSGGASLTWDAETACWYVISMTADRQ